MKPPSPQGQRGAGCVRTWARGSQCGRVPVTFLTRRPLQKPSLSPFPAGCCRQETAFRRGRASGVASEGQGLGTRSPQRWPAGLLRVGPRPLTLCGALQRLSRLGRRWGPPRPRLQRGRPAVPAARLSPEGTSPSGGVPSPPLGSSHSRTPLSACLCDVNPAWMDPVLEI